jgi:hypothetical protein
LDVLFHELRDDLVLALELGLKRRDDVEVFSAGRRISPLEGAGAVLEEDLLPGVEEGRRELVLVAEVGDGHAIDQVPLEDGNVLGRRVVLARLSHGMFSCRVLL